MISSNGKVTVVYNNVYIEIKSKLAFSANPNYYDYPKNRILRYQYKLVRNHILLTRYPSMADLADTAKRMSVDSGSVTIHTHNQNNRQWNAIIQGDTYRWSYQGYHKEDNYRGRRSQVVITNIVLFQAKAPVAGAIVHSALRAFSSF